MRQDSSQTDKRPPPAKAADGGELYDVLAALLVSGDAPEADDMAAYLAELDDVDMDPAKKAELIHTLWQIVQTLVRIQFGFDPALDALGEGKQEDRLTSNLMVGSPLKTNSDFGAAASGERERP
ncbi:MAG: hypothetical protein GYB36_12835 [Alphaproteobacteria bacterium]|nr:hypothetical protein [Alphaproteobacteria bacterium]